jgi:hypothetical protein
MAAIFAAKAGANTLLLESTRDGGRKILISGGGRCNILPMRVEESRFVTASSPNTLRNILRSWPLPEQIAFFERELGVPLVAESESEKLFPASQRARDVRDRLLAFARESGVDFWPNTCVANLSPQNGGWRIESEDGAALEADAVIMATGGLSVPNTGSDGWGLRMVELLGHTVHATYAALTPVLSEPASFGELAGVSLRVSLTAQDRTRKATAIGGFLFTHHGYSGPAVLDVSHVLVQSRASGNADAELAVQWTDRDEKAWEAALGAEGTRTVGTVVREALPSRLADALIVSAGLDPTRQLAQLRRAERLKLVTTLVRGTLPWTGDEGYKKAEVTGGGVSLAEIDPRTMESRRHKGLFLCGEMLDAFGPIGGYNFLWAWATGRAAGIGAAGRGASSGRFDP